MRDFKRCYRFNDSICTRSWALGLLRPTLGRLCRRSCSRAVSDQMFPHDRDAIEKKDLTQKTSAYWDTNGEHLRYRRGCKKEEGLQSLGRVQHGSREKHIAVLRGPEVIHKSLYSQYLQTSAISQAGIMSRTIHGRWESKRRSRRSNAKVEFGGGEKRGKRSTSANLPPSRREIQMVVGFWLDCFATVNLSRSLFTT